MIKKNLLVFPGNNRINEPAYINRYELIRTMCDRNGYNMQIIDYFEILGDKDFNISNLIDTIKLSPFLKNAEVVFGISYGCNVLLRLIEIEQSLIPRCNRISLWGAYPYWYYYKSLITEGNQTKKYLESQGFKIQPENAMRLEKPIEEMIYNYDGILEINLGWGTKDTVSSNEFNRYIATLNNNIVMCPIEGNGHIIDVYNKNYNSLIFGI